jgi:hypothetical protein
VGTATSRQADASTFLHLKESNMVFAGPLGAFVSGQVLRVDGGGQCWPG